MEKLYFNGDIITMEGEGQYAEAVLVADGKIKAVGAYDAVAAQKGADCEEVDLQGKTLMPGFIDGHGHATMTPAFASLCDLSVCNNFDEIVDALKAFQKERNIPAGEAILGVNYDNNFLEEQAHPTRDVLDRVSTEHLVGVMHVSVHAACCNSLALKTVGFADDMADIPGGEVGRYEDGRINGYLAEAAMYPMFGILGKIMADVVGVWDFGQNLYLSNGVTTIQDGASNPGGLQLLRSLDQMGKLKVDVVAFPSFGELGGGDAIDQVQTGFEDMWKKYNGHVKIGGYKIVLDGSPQARTAWMTEPYVGGGSGVPILSDEYVTNSMRKALADDMQALVHCNGDAAGDQFLNAFETAYAESDNPNKDNLRFTMIHCQTARKDQFEKMAKYKMIPSIFTGHINYWGDVHVKNFGEVRGNRVSPVKEALDLGLIYNFHTDTPVTKPNMLHLVWCAVNRMTRSGKVIGEELKVDVYDALKGITINSAHAYFEEDSKGSIKEGKRADLVVLDANPLKVDVMAIKDIKVLETIKDGVTVYTA